LKIQADAHYLPIKSEFVDTIITSPPYYGSDSYEIPSTIRYIEYGDGVVLGSENEVEDYVAHLVIALRECWRVLKEKSVLWLIIGDKDDEIPVSMAPQRLAIALEKDGWTIAQEIHWVRAYRKSGRVRCFDHPESTTEKVYMLVKGQHRYYENRCRVPPPFRENVWGISPAVGKGLWPVLPDRIIEECLFLSTASGDVVLDPFSGSGAVPRVAQYWGRVGIGCDIVVGE